MMIGTEFRKPVDVIPYSQIGCMKDMCTIGMDLYPLLFRAMNIATSMAAPFQYQYRFPAVQKFTGTYGTKQSTAYYQIIIQALSPPS
jgi:hypothetical protein